MIMMHEAVTTQSPPDAVSAFFAEVASICGIDPWISQLGGGILAALVLDIAHDSRAFARALGIEHALVLREVQVLADLGRLKVKERNARTQRCSYELVPLPVEVPRHEESPRDRVAPGTQIIASTGNGGRQTGGGCGGKGGQGSCRTA
jgi:hypothetical protein